MERLTQEPPTGDLPISIIMAVRAPAPWLPQALASIEQQTHENWELVCAADGSDDEIQKEVERLGPRARYLPLPLESGAAECRNAALSSAVGDLVAVLDSDDVWHPEHLAQQKACFAAQPDLILRGTCALVINGDGAVQGDSIQVPSQLLAQWLLVRNVFIHSSVMFRRVVAARAGGYNPALIIGEDLDLWVRMAALGRLSNGAEAMVQYRRHEKQTTQTRRDSAGAVLILHNRLKLGKSLGIPSAFVRALHFMWLMKAR